MPLTHPLIIAQKWFCIQSALMDISFKMINIQCILKFQEPTFKVFVTIGSVTTDTDKCVQDKYCDSWNLLKMVPGTYL